MRSEAKQKKGIMSKGEGGERKKATKVTTIATTDYLAGYQYLNDALQFFPTAEGYVKHTLVAPNDYTLPQPSFDYVYNFADHLGNVRLSYTKDPNTGSLVILEENNYYPFSLKHTAYNSLLKEIKFSDFGIGKDIVTKYPVPSIVEVDYEYKYNGKELQAELGLQWYDYGARNYDANIGRWMNVDPLSEQTGSSYDYCYNNPVNLVDPNGMSTEGWGLKDGEWHYKDEITKDNYESLEYTEFSDGYSNSVQIISNYGVIRLKPGGGWDVIMENCTDKVASIGNVFEWANYKSDYEKLQRQVAQDYQWEVNLTRPGAPTIRPNVQPSIFDRRLDPAGTRQIAHGVLVGTGIMLSEAGFAQIISWANQAKNLLHLKYLLRYQPSLGGGSGLSYTDELYRIAGRQPKSYGTISQRGIGGRYTGEIFIFSRGSQSTIGANSPMIGTATNPMPYNLGNLPASYRYIIWGSGSGLGGYYNYQKTIQQNTR